MSVDSMDFSSTANESTILVVDDSIISINLISECISGLATILVAKDGGSALSIAKQSIPDLILLDIEMPGMNGLEVCKELKKDPLTADIAIIFITAHNHTTNEIDAFGLGGIDFIHKPINKAVLSIRVSTQLKLIKRTKHLVDARNELSQLIQALPVFISHWSTSLQNTYSNDFSGKWFNLPSPMMRSTSLPEIFSKEQMTVIQPCIDTVLEGQNTIFDMPFQSTDNKLKHIQLSLIGKQSFSGINGFLLIINDITERKQKELKLKQNHKALNLTLNTIGDGVVTTDKKGNITFMNVIAEDFTGYTNEEAVGKPIETIIKLYDSITKEPRNNPISECLATSTVVKVTFDSAIVHKRGSHRDIEKSAATICNEKSEVIGAVLTFHDVTEAKASKAKMSYLANYDPLTNLPNRVLLLDRLEQVIKKATLDNTLCALLIFNINNFTNVNHSHGYLVGDHLLISVAEFLKAFLRQSDTLARQGGDEFVILLTNAGSAEHVDEFCRRLLKEFQRDWNIQNNKLDLTFSIGVSLFPSDGGDAQTIFRRANAALQETKQLDSNNYQFFNSEIEEHINAQNSNTVALREAISQGQIEVFYHAKYDGRNDQIFGFEALARWVQKDSAILLPDFFIPLAEKSKLIIPLGIHVLESACKQAVIWQQELPDLTIAVNISSVQFNPSLVDTISAILRDTGMPAHLLELEITESILLNDKHSHTTFALLKALGCKICMDDFGTGYSSLSYIKNYPLDTLKIDQSFVCNMLMHEVDLSIIETIINLAKNLKLSLVAEGVETKKHADTLLAMGCDQFQGYYYSKPQSATNASYQVSEQARNRKQ